MFYKIINRKKRIATRVADVIGYALWFPLNILKGNGKIEAKGVREILVVRTAYIGDVVMTMPVLRPLRDLFPKAKITFLTSVGANDLFKDNPCVDSVIAYDAFWFYPGNGLRGYLGFLKALRKKRYDLVIEARGDIRDILFIAYPSRSRYRVGYNVGGGGFLLTHVVPFKEVKHKVEYHLDIVRFLGAFVDKLDWGLSASGNEDKKAIEALGADGGRSHVIAGIHPGGRKGLKCWGAEKFALLADRLVRELGARVYFTGSAQEASLVEEILGRMSCKGVSLAGKTSLRTSAAVIGRFDVFVTNDSAPLHLASAQKTPTVAIFGPSKSNETGPYGNAHRVVEKDFPCRFSCDEDVCGHTPYNECMESIGVDDVFDAAVDLLEATGRRINGSKA
ncbi:MAG: glycosyltransferase family 9 protein [Deltaproteobacteria bacterium]|nr:glycosyltransferase family 9 protein [Deltaproteobacteria bacterium]